VSKGRRQELAVRAALGASRARIAADLLPKVSFSNSLEVDRLGLAYAALAFLRHRPRGLPRVREIGIDGGVLLFTLLISLLASIMFASIPIFKYAGVRLSTGIREGGRALSQRKSNIAREAFLSSCKSLSRSSF